MMDRKTGVALIYVDVANSYYARYAGCAGRTVECTNAWKSDRPLTQGEVEGLRAEPAQAVPQPEEPKVA